MATAAATTERRAPAHEWREPLPLGIAALLAVAVLVVHGLTARGIIGAFLVAVLVGLAAVDLKRRIIPNRAVLPATAIVLVANIATSPDRTAEWIGAAIGAALFLALPLIFLRGGIGMGDLKLALLLGAGLGEAVVDALFWGTLAGCIVGLVVLRRHGREGRQMTFPYGPALAFGGIVATFTGPVVF